ncbi:MAG: hypothetical protein U0452_00975 [Anaerolineae bacterium]
MSVVERSRISPHTRNAVAIHHWLTSMRSTDGFGGPVSHWWRNSLQYTGTGLDWRYEGIISGYLTLFQRSGSDLWLRFAQQAGDDLVAGQTSSSSFVASSFELNPYPGGNPGEAACDGALIRLASVLKTSGDYAWERYLLTAERNLRDHYITRLWDRDAQVFSDSLDHATFVPNKAATVVEALFLYAEMNGNSEWVERFGLPTLDAILRHQISTGPLEGAIYQYGHGGRPVEWFFPYYAARCIPALHAAYAYNGDERFRGAALKTADFIMRYRAEDGSFPQIVYSPKRVNRYPRWIAGAGDILRALDLANELGASHDTSLTEQWLISGLLPNGAIRTAHGFAAQASQKLKSSVPEFRDVMPVCGWVDKAFAWLCSRIDPGSPIPPTSATQSVEEECTLRGKRCVYRETDQTMELWQNDNLLYRWNKGEMWADIHTSDLYWK